MTTGLTDAGASMAGEVVDETTAAEAEAETEAEAEEDDEEGAETEAEDEAEENKWPAVCGERARRALRGGGSGTGGSAEETSS